MDDSLVAVYSEEMIRLSDQSVLSDRITSRAPAFGVDDAYRVARGVLSRRERSGWRRAGRKIGFTNRTIYAEYGVYEPIFGYMYDRTIRYADDSPPLPPGEGRGEGPPTQASLSLAGLSQPRIEPEIAFMLRERPPETADLRELLRSVEWLAHGFEIVQCHFPDWKFKVADTIADGGLHGRYVIGPRLTIERRNIDSFVEQLAAFRVSLFKDGTPVAEGGGEFVLGSPLNALAHLIDVLDKLPDHPPLEAGELVTTGTLTAALPVTPGETWSTRIDGLPLAGFALRFS